MEAGSEKILLFATSLFLYFFISKQTLISTDLSFFGQFLRHFQCSKVLSFVIPEGEIFNVDEFPAHLDPEGSAVGFTTLEITNNLVNDVHA